MAMGGNEEMLTLMVWFHPSMQVPFQFDSMAFPFQMEASATVMDLMDECEEVFAQASVQIGGPPMELQINVLWNVRDHSKALNPDDRLGRHFRSGDTFGVYGDIQPARECPVPKAEEEKIPVTILTGFLGSGKTTLLNYILHEQRDRKIAIIENEFGEISIDDALLKQAKMDLAEKIVVLDNGCICCTIRGDLAKGLKSIVDEVKAGNTIDGVMIETTGMADPVPIVRTFMADPEITQDLRLDAVVTMADAKNLLGRLDDGIEEGKVNEAYQQIAFADKVILNKLDLITADHAIVVKDRIREINKYAKVLPAVRGRIKLTELTDIRAHDMVNFVNTDIENEPEEEEGELGHGGGHDDGHGGGHGDGHDQGGHSAGHEEGGLEEHGGGHGGGHGGSSPGHGGGHNSGGGGSEEGQGHGVGHGHRATKGNRHDSRVNSFAIVREGEIIPPLLSAWMQELGSLPPEKGTIFRIKAILAVKGHPFKHVFHAVMDVNDEDDAGPWAPGEKKISKIVFIGKGLDQKFLREGFESIFEGAAALPLPARGRAMDGFASAPFLGEPVKVEQAQYGSKAGLQAQWPVNGPAAVEQAH